MAKRRPSKPGQQGKSKLALALEAGEPVSGLTGFVETTYDDNPVFVRVKCLRIVTDEDGCGIKVEVVLASSPSKILITPCQFYDSAAKVDETLDRRERIEAARHDHAKLGRSRYNRNRREDVELYVSQLSEPQQARFWAEVQERLHLANPPTKLPQMAVSDLRTLAMDLVCDVHGVTGEELEAEGRSHISSWSW